MTVALPKKTMSMSVKTSNKRKRDDVKKAKIVEDKSKSDDDNDQVQQESDDEIEEDSEDSEDSESDLASDDDDDIPVPQKKQKKSVRKETEKFSNAMNALLDTHLKAYDRKDPILARSKKELKTFENDKLEQKAKRLLLNEKKKKLTANRVQNLLPTDDKIARSVFEHEKKLKKTAQKGVIKLFNAILMTQTSTLENINNESSLLGQSKKKELVNEISKEKFLSLVQQAGK